jgi:flagellar motor switch protein FliM
VISKGQKAVYVEQILSQVEVDASSKAFQTETSRPSLKKEEITDSPWPYDFRKQERAIRQDAARR